MRRLVLTLLFFFALTSASSAAPRGQFSWGDFPLASNGNSYLDTQGGYPVGLQETWVNNPTRCAWGDQSFVDWAGDGDLASGQTATGNACLIADYGYFTNVATFNYPKQAAFRVTASTDVLQVSLADDAGHLWPGPPPARSGKRWVWQLCVQDRVARGGTEETLPTYYSTIPGSNGGYGQRVNVELSVKNASSRTARGVTAILETRWNAAGIGPAPWLDSVPCPPRSPN